MTRPGKSYPRRRYPLISTDDEASLMKRSSRPPSRLVTSSDEDEEEDHPAFVHSAPKKKKATEMPDLPPPPTVPSALRTPVRPSTSFARSAEPKEPAGANDKAILTLLHELKAHVKQNTVLLQALKSRQDQVQVDDVINVEEEYGFPLSTDEAFLKAEDILREKKDKAVVTYLASFGGHTSDNKIKRIMEATLTNGLAISFNWAGRGQKRAFSRTSLAKSVLGAAKKVGLPYAEAEQKIKNWLKYSNHRLNGRKTLTKDTTQEEIYDSVTSSEDESV
ncbi:uncharacterized protein LOC117345346 [Pecten maximus]|uniref:uncharacterized protein LOC117345346 n=1 Tax=Pecten maximus TaxID=6579 RepID=UPI0014591101|nr:uncharacterized protein LOC117345346 [Pecten maximus]